MSLTRPSPRMLTDTPWTLKTIADLEALDTAGLPDGQQVSVSDQAPGGVYTYNAGASSGGIAPDAGVGRWLLTRANVQGRQYPTRAAFEADVAAGYAPADGTVVSAGGVQYVASAGATAVPGLAGWLPFGDVTVLHFGAVINGSTNDSAAWIAAVNYIGDQGGGNVYAGGSRGVSIAEGIPLRERVIIDLNECVIRSPVSPSTSIFILPDGVTGSFTGGGVVNGTIDGRNKTQRGIDFRGTEFQSPITLTKFLLDNATIENCSTGFHGSGNDRFPLLRGSRIRNNDVGVWIVANHPILDHCDIRGNDVGVTGSANDFYAVGSKFNFNRIGIIADPTQGSGNIRNSYFVGCMFFKNSEIALEINRNCVVTSCLMVGVESGDIGVSLVSKDCIVSNNTFAQDTLASTGFGDAAVKIHKGTHVERHNITGNNFTTYANSGPAVKGGAVETNYRNISIRGNTFNLQGSFKAIDFPETSFCFNPDVSDNQFRLRVSMTTGNRIVSFTSLGFQGIDFSNNTFTAAADVSPVGGAAVGLPDAAGSVISENRFVDFSQAFSVSGGSADAIWSNNYSSVANSLTLRHAGREIKGDNANGSFVITSGGRLICTHAIDLGSRTTFGSGTLADPYRTNNPTWQFPRSFAAPPTVQVTPQIISTSASERASSAMVGSIGTGSVVNVQAFMSSSDSTNIDVVGQIKAEGDVSGFDTFSYP